MKRIRPVGVLLGACLLLAAGGPAGARAQAVDEGADAPGWSVRLASFLSLSNLDGVHGVRGSEVAVRDSALRAGIVGRVEVWHGRWGAIAELGGAAGRGSLSAVESGPGPGGFDLRVLRTEVLGAVRVGRGPATGALEVLAGGRYVRHTRELDPTVAPSTPDLVRQAWADPVAGARYVAAIGEPFRFAVTVTIGGATGSDFTWVVDGTLGLRLLPRTRLLTRYRYEETEYDSAAGDYRWDGRAQGWLFGLGVEL